MGNEMVIDGYLWRKVEQIPEPKKRVWTIGPYIRERYGVSTIEELRAIFPKIQAGLI